MTASVAEVVPRHVSGKYDRAFYSSMAIGMALTVLVGFGPTYYMKPFSHTPIYPDSDAGRGANRPHCVRDHHDDRCRVLKGGK